jgi:glycosyltransferase involved in cell wall biosynthesis
VAEAAPKGILCFAGQDWWYHNRAHSDFQLMIRAAKRHDVLLVNSIGMRLPLPGRSTQPLRRILRKARSVARFLRQPVPSLPRFHVFTPLLIPLYETAWGRRLNAHLVAAQVRAALHLLGIDRPVAFLTLPTAWDVVGHIPHGLLAFNRSDKHSEFGEVDQPYIRELERQLLKASDVVCYVSHEFMREEAALTGERALFLDHGVDLEHFHRRGADEEPPDLRRVPHPRIGFFGGFDDYVIDFELLERLARELPEAQLVLIGDATCSMKRFERYSNVHWLGFRPYEDIPRYGSHFDVAIMPWLQNDWIRRCNPIKLKEYLALELPIVSTAFPELGYYTDLVRVADGRNDFVELVRKSLADGGPGSPRARRARVEEASWDRITEDLLRACGLSSGRPA